MSDCLRVFCCLRFEGRLHFAVGACQRWRPYRRPCFGWLCEYPFLRVLRLAVSPLRRLTFLQGAPKKVTKNACPNVRPTRWGSGFLRSGIDPGASSPVCCAAPPLDVFGFAKRSLRSHPRINPGTKPADGAGGSRSRAAAELALILLSGGRACDRLLFCVGAAPHASPLPRERGPICGLFKIGVRLSMSCRRSSSRRLGQSPLRLAFWIQLTLDHSEHGTV